MSINSSSLITRFYRPVRVMRGIVASAKLDMVIATIALAASFMGVRQLGWLQPLELAAFDLMVRLRPDEGPDPRLLVVTITEQDIKALKQYPIPDGVLAKVLAEL